MARIVYSDNALSDFQRLFNYLHGQDPDAAPVAANVIRQTVGLLEEHPLIGRRIEGELRELVISYGKTGYVALYRFLPDQNLIRVLGVRHQRELDYPV